MRCSLLLTFLLSAFLINAVAQEDHPVETGHDHEHHGYEIGIANLLVYMGGDNEYSYGLHLHAVRNLGESHFGVGLGFERIFDEHGHNTIGLVGSYRATDHLVFNLTPGVSFEDREADHLKFAMHIEGTYEFVIKNIHIGPLIEFAFDTDDYHLSLGLHIGFGF